MHSPDISGAAVNQVKVESFARPGDGELPFQGEPPLVRLSVVVPVLNGGSSLPSCLGELADSDLPRARWELIVVDDGSSDGSGATAARWADKVISLEGPPKGPAYARNRGAEAAAGTHLVFLDADVRPHRDALRRLSEQFEQHPEVAAVFGAYDTAPAAVGLVSQYRNLLHHYVHRVAAGEAATFWAGLGAIRADVFRGVGGFDARRYPRPQVEDIDLGYRLRALGHRIALRPEIQGTHLKRWTLGAMIVTDVRDRGVPWMRLLRRTGSSGTLNIRAIEKVHTGLAALAMAAALAALLTLDDRWLLVTALAAGVVLAGNLRLFGWFARTRGVVFALGTVPLRLLYYALNVVSAVVGFVVPEPGGASGAVAPSVREARGGARGC